MELGNYKSLHDYLDSIFKDSSLAKMKSYKQKKTIGKPIIQDLNKTSENRTKK